MNIELCKKEHLYQDISFSEPMRTIAQEGQDFILLLNNEKNLSTVSLDMNSSANNCISNIGSLQIVMPATDVSTENGVSSQVPRSRNQNIFNITTSNTAEKSFISSINIAPSATLSITTRPSHSGSTAIRSVTTDSFKINGSDSSDEPHNNTVTIEEITANTGLLNNISGSIRSFTGGPIAINNCKLSAGVINSDYIKLTNNTHLTLTTLQATGIIGSGALPVPQATYNNSIGEWEFGATTRTLVRSITATSDCIFDKVAMKAGSITIQGETQRDIELNTEFIQDFRCQGYNKILGSIQGDTEHVQEIISLEGDINAPPTVSPKTIREYTGSTVQLTCSECDIQVSDICSFQYFGIPRSGPSVRYSGGAIFEGAVNISDEPDSSDFKKSSRNRSVAIVGFGANWIFNPVSFGVRMPVPDTVFILGDIKAPRVTLVNFVNYGNIVATEAVILQSGVNYGTIRSPRIITTTSLSSDTLINSGELLTSLSGNVPYNYTNPF
tara:strand:- start:52319 stop:53812 length:1494 start_codon:yes stop_codon:yes gene_type:complete